ncbi:hypothetical protein IGI67_005150 [Enterococcus sp. AZ196]
MYDFLFWGLIVVGSLLMISGLVKIFKYYGVVRFITTILTIKTKKIKRTRER